MAEGYAAIHAAGSLAAELLFLHGKVKFVPVVNALEGGPVQRELSEVFDKSSRFSHGCIIWG
jgi:hypothetical protein